MVYHKILNIVPCAIQLDLVIYPSYIGKDWGQEEKGTTQDEMAGWHH